MRFQFYPSFGLKYTETKDEYLKVASCYLIIGPFQFNWYRRIK